MSEHQDLGPCCVCTKHDATVRNLVCLPWKLPVDLRDKAAGWGCVVCGLEPDGATAIICDACAGKYGKEEGYAWVQFVIGGKQAERFPFSKLDQTNQHEHDLGKHDATIRYAS